MTGAAGRVALVDDDDDLRASTAQMLDLAGFAVDQYPAAPPALAAIGADFPGVVITDVRMPQMSGIELFHTLHARDAGLPVILFTGHADVPMAVAALKDGAWDFIPKPFDPAALIASVTRATTARGLALENRRLRAAIEADPSGGLVGRSPAITRLRDMIPLLAEADIDLLIEGETGTGKALLARLIHRAGKRRRHRFHAIACTVVPDPLLDTELFARSGAGSVVAASRGTLFLDDLDQASPAMQTRLTRLVEQRALGDTPIDLRVIATAAEEARRPADAIAPPLLYRVAAMRLRMPPLRERPEDVAPLFAHFVGIAAAHLGRPVPPLTEAVQLHLAGHHWPGNVRELGNFADRFVLGLETVAPADPPDMAASLPDRIAGFEREAIIAAIAAAGGEIGAAIAALGIPRKTFYYRVNRLGIDLRRLRRDTSR